MMFTARSPSLFENDPRWKVVSSTRRTLGPRTGVLPSQALHALIERKEIIAGENGIDARQVQPASLDLRLGPVAYRIRASFLPGKGGTVESKLAAMQSHVIDLTKGAVLETECVYLVPLMERLDLRSTLSATANPKSSTGRADVFTRVITDDSPRFDEIADGYSGGLWLEVVPLSFPIRVREDLSLNQLRLSVGRAELTDAELRDRHRQAPLLFRGGENRRRQAEQCDHAQLKHSLQTLRQIVLASISKSRSVFSCPGTGSAPRSVPG